MGERGGGTTIRKRGDKILLSDRDESYIQAYKGKGRLRRPSQTAPTGIIPCQDLAVICGT